MPEQNAELGCSTQPEGVYACCLCVYTLESLTQTQTALCLSSGPAVNHVSSRSHQLRNSAVFLVSRTAISGRHLVASESLLCLSHCMSVHCTSGQVYQCLITRTLTVCSSTNVCHAPVTLQSSFKTGNHVTFVHFRFRTTNWRNNVSLDVRSIMSHLRSFHAQKHFDLRCLRLPYCHIYSPERLP